MNETQIKVEYVTTAFPPIKFLTIITYYSFFVHPLH